MTVQGWVFAMAKTIFAGTVKKTVKTVVKKAKTLVFVFHFINYLLCFSIIFMAVASYLALLRSVLDLNCIVSLHCSNAIWVLLYKVCFITV